MSNIKTVGELVEFIKSQEKQTLVIGDLKLTYQGLNNDCDLDIYYKRELIAWLPRPENIKDEFSENQKLSLMTGNIEKIMLGKIKPEVDPFATLEEAEPAMESIDLNSHKQQIAEKDQVIANLKGKIDTYDLLFGSRKEINVK